MFLFFIRHFNDFNHIAPIIWKMVEDGCPVAVYCMNPSYDIDGDYRLRYLKNQGATVNYLYQAFDQDRGTFYRIMQKVVQKCSDLEKKYENSHRRRSGMLTAWIGQLAGQLRSVLYKTMRWLYYSEEWAASILEKTGARVICFDHVMPNHYEVDAFLKASRRLSVPSVALPHGVYLYTPMKQPNPKQRMNGDLSSLTVSTLLS